VDKIRIQRFAKSISATLKVHYQVDGADILGHIDDVLNSKASQFDCIMFYFAGHGEPGVVIGNDYETCSQGEIEAHIGQVCPFAIPVNRFPDLLVRRSIREQ
jgi:hypothetical protein